MKTDRRRFIKNTALIGGLSAINPLSLQALNKTSKAAYPDYSKLDEILNLPVLKRELFSSPVVIETLELLRDRDNFICRVRSKDGAVGISIGHPFISKQGYPMFMNSLHRHFIGKDARDLDKLIFNASERNVKSQGIPLCVQIATIEFAILDMLGNIAHKPVGQLIGDIHVPEISVYLGTRLSELPSALVDGSLTEVDSSLRRLGQTWCDQDFEVFASRVRQTRQRLASFSVDAQKAGSMIEHDADRIERFRKVRLPE